MSGVAYVKLPFSPFFYSLIGELCHTSLKVIYINYLELSCTGDLSILPYLCMYVCKSVWIHGYYFVFESQSSSILFCCSNYPSMSYWVLFQLAPVFLLQTSFIVFEYFLTFQPYTVLQVHFGTFISSPSPGISHFFKEPWFLYGSMVLETKKWALGVLIATQGVISSRPSQQTEQGNTCVYRSIYHLT